MPIDLNPFDEWGEKMTNRVLASMEGVDGAVNDVRRVVQRVDTVVITVHLFLLALGAGAKAFTAILENRDVTKALQERKE
jgi:hypothetical protein